MEKSSLNGRKAASLHRNTAFIMPHRRSNVKGGMAVCRDKVRKLTARGDQRGGYRESCPASPFSIKRPPASVFLRRQTACSVFRFMAHSPEDAAPGRGFAPAGCVRSLNRRGQRPLVSADSFGFLFVATGDESLTPQRAFRSPFGNLRGRPLDAILFMQDSIILFLFSKRL